MLKARKNIKWKKLHNKSHLMNLKYSKLNYKNSASKIHFGDFGLKAVSSGFLTFKQIEAARRVISRSTGRNGKIWIRVYPDHVITKKSKNSRMGKGVGAFHLWCFFVKEGTVIFEINRILLKKIYLALTAASKKLPVRTKVVSR